MATLYKRATPPQARMLRIIEGAIRDAQGVHSDLVISERHRRSIAKRATGTLSSQWGDVLAEARSANRGRPERASGQVSDRRPGSVKGHPAIPTEGTATPDQRRARRGRHSGKRRSPLSILAGELGNHIGRLQRAGQDEDAKALITAVRIIAAVDLTGGFP